LTLNQRDDIVPIVNSTLNERMTQRERRAVLSLWKKCGYTKAAFARELGVHRSAVSMWSSGRSVSLPMDDAARRKAAELKGSA
jgi:DNA-binding transcriptional regulator YiaG